MLLSGESKLNLDEKGRLAIPSRYREMLLASCAGRLVITMNHEKRLLVYPVNEWEPAQKNLSALSDFNKVEAKIKRLYLGHAIECVMDKNGRINIPPSLRDKSRLGKQVVLTGVGKKFELWDEESWNAEWENDDLGIELTESLSSIEL